MLTLDPARPLAAGLCIRAGRVVSLDPPADALALPPGAVAVPAFVDAHLHLAAWAAARCSVPLDDAADLADVLDRLRAAGAAAPPGTWVRAWGIDEAFLGDGRLPTTEELDAAVPRNPVVVHHRTGHTRLVNGLAAGGDAPPLDAALLGDAAAAVGAVLAAAGVVAVTDATHTNDVAALDLLDRFRLPQRVEAMVGADRFGWLRPGARVGGVTVGPAKIMPPAVGLGRVAVLASAAREAGFAVAVHAVDVDEVDAALGALAPGDRIEHLGLCLPEQVDVVARLGVTVVTQPSFVTRRAPKYRRDLTPIEQGWLYRLRSLVDAGVEVIGSSDAPVVPARPLDAVAAAVTRDLGPSERLGVTDALRLMCRPLRVGGPGDVVVLGADPGKVPPTALDRVPVLATYREGRALYVTEVMTPRSSSP